MNILPPTRLKHSQIVSRNSMEVLLGAPRVRMMIFSGIAMPEFQSLGQLDGQEITIDLEYRSNVERPAFTATVGLASLYNSNSDFVFATDDVKVTTEPDLNLVLVCNIAALGDRSALNRFSYQAIVMMQADTGRIAGTIRWSPHTLTFAVADLFDIAVFSMPPPPPSVPGAAGSFAPSAVFEKAGAIIGTVFKEGSRMGIRYEATGLRLGVTYVVHVSQRPGAFVKTNTDGEFGFIQVSGPNPTPLSAGHPVEQPLDFEARELQRSPR